MNRYILAGIAEDAQAGKTVSVIVPWISQFRPYAEQVAQYMDEHGYTDDLVITDDGELFGDNHEPIFFSHWPIKGADVYVIPHGRYIPHGLIVGGEIIGY